MNVLEIKSKAVGKLIFSVFNAFFVTVSLLMLMYHLIDIDFVIEDESPFIPVVGVFEPKPPTTIIDKRPVKPQEPAEPPELPQTNTSALNPIDVNFVKPAISPTNELEINLISGDFPIASFLSNPVYPRIALNKSIEGFVDVKFDVTKYGSTENISVVLANPEGIFERSALKAVKRWRFQPVMKQGEPQAFSGMVRRITYQMQN